MSIDENTKDIIWEMVKFEKLIITNRMMINLARNKDLITKALLLTISFFNKWLYMKTILITKNYEHLILDGWSKVYKTIKWSTRFNAEGEVFTIFHLIGTIIIIASIFIIVREKSENL